MGHAGWRKINGKERPELDAWRAENKPRVASGEWTWEDYKREYRREYNKLPDVAAKKAAKVEEWRKNNTPGAPPELAAAIQAARDNPPPEKPCAVCGQPGARWLVHDGTAAPESHPWYCRYHWMQEVTRRKAEREPGVVDFGRRLEQEKGGTFAKALAKWLVALSATEVRDLWYSRNKQAPVVKPATAPPSPAKNGLESLLD